METISELGFTVGKVYKFVDGKVADDDGDMRPFDENVTALGDEYMRNWTYKFIPYKGKANE